ncbi:MAG TPA: PDZ domain-containing protein [Kofleriaceae bacterium]
MSQRERRIPWIAVGVAAVGIAIAAWRIDRLRSAPLALASRHVSASDLVKLRPGSSCAALGLEDGDVIRAINGTPLVSADQVLELVARAPRRSRSISCAAAGQCFSTT